MIEEIDLLQSVHSCNGICLKKVVSYMYLV